MKRGMKLKKISICIPCYNEEDNVIPITEAIINIFKSELSEYQYEILFIDNASEDETQNKIREMCMTHKQVKAIFNVRNFRYDSGEHGLRNTDGNCSIFIPADFQVPVALIPEMVHRWEKGAIVVCAIKKKSEERKSVWFMRQAFYGFAEKISNVKFIPNYTGYGLYDEKFMKVYKQIHDPLFSTMQFISTHGWNIEEVYFVQPKRRAGKSKTSLYDLFDVAILRLTNMSTVLPRFASATGLLVAIIGLIIAVAYLIMKLIYWNAFQAGIIPILLCVIFLSSIQLIFLGIIGEYVMKANIRLMDRPLVIEQERINFEAEDIF